MELGVGDDLDFACFCLSVFLVFLSVCFGTKVKVLGVFRKGGGCGSGWATRS